MKRVKENNHQLCVREHKNICGNFSCDFVWSQLPLWNKSLFTAVKLLKLFHLSRLSSQLLSLYSGRKKWKGANFQHSSYLNILKLKSQHQKGDLRGALIEGGKGKSKVAMTFDSINSGSFRNHVRERMFIKIWTRQVSVDSRWKTRLLRTFVLWIYATVFRFKNISKLHFRFLSSLFGV